MSRVLNFYLIIITILSTPSLIAKDLEEITSIDKIFIQIEFWKFGWKLKKIHFRNLLDGKLGTTKYKNRCVWKWNITLGIGQVPQRI